MNEEELQYLTKLVSKAKQKVEEEHGIEISVPQIDKTMDLDKAKAFVIQSIKADRDKKIESKPKVALKDNKEEDKAKAEKEAKEEQERIKALKEQEEKTIQEWKKQFNPEMVIKSPAYFEMEKYIEMVCKKFSNFCVVSSRGGLAKTWSSQAILQKHGVNYAYLNSFTSPLELYNFLHDHREDEVILIDDCEGIWDSKPIISIFKNATELNGERTIAWNSTTSKLEGRPNTCKFNSRIVLLTNQLPNADKNPHVEALLSRSFLCKLNFSYKEIMDIIKEVSKRDYKGMTAEARKEVFEFVERNSNEATKELSIRTLIKLYHFNMFDKANWKQLGVKLLKTDDTKEIVLNLMNGKLSVKEQEEAFNKKTGKSRASFYRVKAEIMPKSEKYIEVGEEQK